MPDPTDTPAVNLDLEGEVTLEALVQAAEALLSMLRDIDAQATQRAGGSLNWVVKDLEGGSAHVVVAPAAKDERTPIWAGRTVTRAFGEGMAQIARGGDRPKYFTDTALRKALALNSLLGAYGVSAVRVRVDGAQVDLTRDTARKVKDVVEGTLRSIGSIEGKLETISVHGQPYVNVFDSVTGHAIRCNISHQLVDKARDALKKRVQVFGTIYSRPSGEITSVRVRDFEVFEDEIELPTVEMMRGILRND